METAGRREPQQPRSLRKVRTILDTAMRLFQESGMDAVSMREIAREAYMPIATVYQYFPNKPAIVRRLWEEYTTTINDQLESEMEEFRADPTSQSVQRLIDHMVNRIADTHLQNPAFVEIRRCVDATPELRRLNMDDTLQVAAQIKTAILIANPNAVELEVGNFALIASEATSSTIKLGLEMPPPDRDTLYASLKRFLLLVYESLTASGGDWSPSKRASMIPVRDDTS